MKPFGPGRERHSRSLFGLDYRMAAWRGDEENPFHTEVGYWLWDAADAQVFRCFVVPRGSLVLAGGDATPDAKSFTMHAECGSEIYGVLSNRFLATAARTSNYKCTVTVNDDGTWAYDELDDRRARALRRRRRAHRPQPAAPRRLTRDVAIASQSRSIGASSSESSWSVVRPARSSAKKCSSFSARARPGGEHVVEMRAAARP